MYIAVAHYETKPWMTVMCVAAFILSGTNHCVADMFYLTLGEFSHEALTALFWTTVGNIIGTNLIPFFGYSAYLSCTKREI
jgi:formate/nitrite transporter FocA (FNT family)